MLWLLALAAPVLLLAPNLAGVWLGEGRMAPMAAVSLAPPLLTLAGLALLALVQARRAAARAGGLGGWPRCWWAPRCWRCCGAAAGWRRPASRRWRASCRFIATIGLTNLIGLLNYRVGLFVIERLLGLSATGVYSIAVVVAELLWFVSGSLTQAVYSRIGTPDRARAAATTRAGGAR